MAFDPRQVVAAFLTLSMFAMLGNMIKKDHFDSNEVKHPTLAVQFDVMKVEEHISMEKKGPWMEKSSALKSCWNRPASKEGDKGFITFSLTTGPEYHFPQFFKYIFRDRDFGGQDIKVSLEVSFMEAVQGCAQKPCHFKLLYLARLVMGVESLLELDLKHVIVAEVQE